MDIESCKALTVHWPIFFIFLEMPPPPLESAARGACPLSPCLPLLLEIGPMISNNIQDSGHWQLWNVFNIIFFALRDEL